MISIAVLDSRDISYSTEYPLPVQTAELQLLLDELYDAGRLPELYDPHSYMESVAADFPLPPVTPWPRPRLGSLYWPVVGNARYAFATFLIDEYTLGKIRGEMLSKGSNGIVVLLRDDPTNVSETPRKVFMNFLATRPLVRTTSDPLRTIDDATPVDAWVLLLVDDRYRPINQPFTGTLNTATWYDLSQSFRTYGTGDTPDADYLTPGARWTQARINGRAYSWLADTVALSVGSRYVFNPDGVAFQRPTGANKTTLSDAHAAAVTDSRFVGGGPIEALDYSPGLPEYAAVTFGAPGETPVMTHTTVQSTYLWTGAWGVGLQHWADAPASTSSGNRTALADQWVADWLAWQDGLYDTTYSGFVSIPLSGFLWAVEYYHDDGVAYTKFVRPPHWYGFLLGPGTASNATGTVTSVSVSGSNGIGVSGSPITGSGTIALSLGAITPTSVNGITLSGSGSVANSGTSSLTGFTGSGSSSNTNTGDQTAGSGLSGTSTLTLDLSHANTWAAAQTFPNSSGIKIQDTDASNTLGIVGGSNLTANRTLTVTTGDASRVLTFTADASIGGTNTGDQTAGAGLTGTTTIAIDFASANTWTGLQTIAINDAATTTTSDVAVFKHNSTGTAGNGFGSDVHWFLEDSTTNDQAAALHTVQWVDATHASRRAKVLHRVSDATSSRIYIEGSTDGSNPKIGFLGAASSLAQTGDAGTALVTFGLMSGTPTFNAANLTGTLPASVNTLFNGFTDADWAVDDRLPFYDTSATANRDGETSHLLGLDRDQPGGRLTLTSGTPTGTDVASGSTIYYTPYLHDTVKLWDGTRWKLHQFSEISLALSSLTNGKNYDVFLYNNSGTLTLESLVWTDDSTRATAVTIQDGRYCKSGDKTRLLVGTFRTISTSATQDNAAKRYLSNVYNTVPTLCQNFPGYNDNNATTTITVTGTSPTEINGGTNNRVEVVFTLPQPFSVLTAWNVASTPASNSGRCELSIDSTTDVHAMCALAAGGLAFPALALPYAKTCAAGYHYATMMGQVGGGTMTINVDLGRSGGGGVDTASTFIQGIVMQ